MRRVLLSVLIIFIFADSSYAATAANSGLTGLWEYPTAEMLPDGQGRIGFTKASPYNFHYVDLSWLPWLEINARLNTFGTIDARRGRRYMDKSIDLKFMLWHSKAPENWIIPSIAVGMTDIMGTELMQAKFAAATWRYKKLAATLGYGTDRLNGVYAGLEYDVANWLTVKAEYSPLDYAHDIVSGRRVISEDKMPSKKYNAGIVLKAPWGMEGSVSYQRGNEWVFGISQRINLNGPFIGVARKKFDYPCSSRVAEWEDVPPDELLIKIKEGLNHCVRVRDVDLKLEETNDGRKLYIAYENYGYASHAEAMTRILIALSGVMPENDELILIHKNAGVPIVQASFPGTLLFDIRSKTLRGDDPIHTAVFQWADSEGIESPDEEGLLKTKAQHELKGMFVYEPRIDQTLREEYMDRLNFDVVYTGRYEGGFGSVVDVRFPIYNNVDTSNYTGLWWEKDLNDEIRLQQAGITFANKLPSNNRFWFFGEGGFMDEEWFGANVWTRYYGKDGRWWLGARGAVFHDRDPYSFSALTEGMWKYYRGATYDVRTEKEYYPSAWIQGSYNIVDLDLDINASWGKYLDSDKGYKIELVRHWDDTAIGFYYINTDRQAPDKDFTRAGVHMELPVDKWLGSWFGNPSSHTWEQNTMFLSTWRMNSGREGGMIRSPERLMSQLRPASMRNNVENLLRDYCSYEDEEITKEATSLLEYIIH